MTKSKSTYHFKNINWAEKSFEEICQSFDSLPAIEQLELLKWLSSHHPDIDIDWLDFFEDTRAQLKYAENILACEDFISWFPEFRPKEYAKRYEFIEKDLCDFYIHTGNFKKLKERIQFIQKNPVAGIDTLTIRLYYQLLYNGLYEEAASYAKAIYKSIEESDEIWGNPQTPLIQGIYLDSLQQVYQQYKETGKFDLKPLYALAQELDLQENEEMLRIEKKALQNPLNSAEILNEIKSDNFNYAHCIVELNVYFIKYMYDTYNIPFKLSEYFWSIVSVKNLFGQSDAHDFFYIDLVRFDKILDERVDYMLSSNALEMFGKIWSLHYVYEFLKKHALITPDDARLMDENNLYHHNEMIKYTGNSLWQMSFVFRWPQHHLWSDLRPFFFSTFGTEYETSSYIVERYFEDNPIPHRILDEIEDEKQKSDIKLFANQQPFIKSVPDIGRNGPCHCGSGKKYKKCCMKSK